MQPSLTPLSGGRWVPFVEIWSFQGFDETGADFRMQLRLYPDAPGNPLVDMGVVTSPTIQGLHPYYAGLATIAAHIAAGRMVPDEVAEGALYTDQLMLSLVSVRINETTMEGLPFPAERGDDNVLAWDLHVTPAGQVKQLWAAGPFTIQAGATQ